MGIRLGVIGKISPEHSRDRVGTMPSEVSMSGAANDREPTVEELKRELAEARARPAATVGIVARPSSSPAARRRVSAEIAANAAPLCDAYAALIRQVEGEVLRLVAHHGPTPAGETMPLTRGIPAAHAILA